MRKIDKKEVIKALKVKGIEFVDEYRGVDTKVKLRMVDYGWEFDSRPSGVMANSFSIASRLKFDRGFYDSPIKTKNNPLYPFWASMFQRCYSSNLHKRLPTYKDCTADRKWWLYSSFEKWALHQGDITGKNLDKDLLKLGNKVYSEDNCLFISHKINTLFQESTLGRGKYLTGVHWSKQKKKFTAVIKRHGKAEHLGFFDTEIQARIVYCLAKADYVREVSEAETDFRVKGALLWRTKWYKTQALAANDIEVLPDDLAA